MTCLTRSIDEILSEDLHFHSTFSDGADSVERNIQAAMERGMRRVCCVDHVRRSTRWVPEFVAAIERARERFGALIDISCGVEAKFLDATGRLDLPDDLAGVDFLLAADHQVPTPHGFLSPDAVKERIAAGELDPETVTGWLVDATVGALSHHPSVIVAHPFSVLPKIGMPEQWVSVQHLRAIGHAAVRSGGRIEISERWHCPSPRAVSVWASMGVDLVASTDAHTSEHVGRYDYVSRTLRAALATSETSIQSAA